MENKTLQRVIFELSGQKNNREFAKYIRRSESYTSNMINSDRNISVELGIDMMQRMYLDKELIKEVILNYIDEAFFI
ncbi:hypothetical protein elemo19C_phanotate22 [Flavobacterium phage vB_FspP_elemoA_1-9C]|jgi:hypothetical protein|uniref:Uncharacterized protein n=6 Tax=Elemovirus TaxID=2948694 RepID=A0A7D7K0C6_9CAUD|nr:hypothetical protein KNV10_gp90 [Flavobacterium phage vB_FspP_elemoA_7-9A]YP_010108926.1 hypothetical protein KNV11_gp87 [Flavobacterium phage vB_FspP_elemoF_6-3D]YP_010109014.1 hypothetical protein KNV12_gp87 [Flavobacterium phage vB_FspP_elemoE_6-9C]YP_010109138.1 hypothetical protein KNV13_gp55 [Flavobacterium phage vB_FspP_elemoD_13-5B]YP_010356097.1 hypothetical protein M1M19_gp92 [Flavobacterium phage vB_FspP_elemoB_14-3B]YP_010356458.1 hypothetical protein M1M21_gp90 [Flavobacterium 